jgi:hypothetical protein
MTKTSSTTYFLLAAALVAIGLVIFSRAQPEETSKGMNDTFAQCLTEKGTIMYGAYWCSHCENQKELFGKSFAYVDYVECWNRGTNSQTIECQAAGIDGYPTWAFADGSRRSGEMTLDELSQATGCALKSDDQP